MKRLFFVFSLMLIVTTLTSSKTSNETAPPPPWLDVTVNWTDNCPGPIAVEYQVTMEIKNICQGIGIIYETQTFPISTTNLTTTFIVNEPICGPFGSIHPCYDITFIVRKVSLATGKTLCMDSISNLFNCEDLGNYTGTVINFTL